MSRSISRIQANVKGAKATLTKKGVNPQPKTGKTAVRAKAPVVAPKKTSRIPFVASRYEVCPHSVCTAICKKDAPLMSNNELLFVSLNQEGYYVLINTWLHIAIQESCQEFADDLSDAIRQKGLIPVIGECSDAANSLISQLSDNSNTNMCPNYCTNLISHSESLQAALQILRYPKRFSPVSADKIVERTMQAFLALNKGIDRVEQRSDYNQDPNPSSIYYYDRAVRAWMDRVRYEIEILVPKAEWEKTHSYGTFSSGVAADAARPLADKLDRFATYRFNIFDTLYPLGTAMNVSKRETAGSDNHVVSFCKLKAVNKNYKTARLIAPEDVDRQYDMQSIRLRIEKVLHATGSDGMIDFHDQVPNQLRAFEGSVSSEYSTIDLSSASDSIARALATEVLPIWLYEDSIRCLPTHFEYRTANRTERRRMRIFASSGSAVTFSCETLIFLGIALAVMRYSSAITGEEYLLPVVFGDDMVVDTRIFILLCEVLSTLGFMVNAEKSFSSGTDYRESCGVEYWKGLDCSTRFFPRKSLDFRDKATTVASLCSMEQRLYSYSQCRRFLCDVVRTYYPVMSSHLPSTVCADLWENIPRCKDKFLVAGCDASAREYHYVTRSKYSNNLEERLPQSGWTRLQLVEMYVYAEWLRVGPTYDEPILELLRISSKPVDRRSLTSKTETTWEAIIE